MTNVSKVFNLPEPQKKIADMKMGEHGYTVHWAYDWETGVLNEGFPIYEMPKGTATLFVSCVQPGLYNLDFSKVQP